MLTNARLSSGQRSTSGPIYIVGIKMSVERWVAGLWTFAITIVGISPTTSIKLRTCTRATNVVFAAQESIVATTVPLGGRQAMNKPVGAKTASSNTVFPTVTTRLPGYAPTSTTKDAITGPVTGYMHVDSVGDTYLSKTVKSTVDVQDHLHGISRNKDYWFHNLRTMPESDVKTRVLDYLNVGIPVGYVGDISFDMVENWPSTDKYKQGVHDHITTHLNSGAIEGPIDIEHFPHKISPLGAFPKKNSQKTRVIHDLSFPPGNSVNDGINGEECSVTYSTVLDAVELCKKYPTPWLAKYDIKDAYMHCAVKRSDRHLLGFRWYDDDGKLVVYRHSSIPFGMRSSCRAFSDIAECLMFMCKNNGAADDSLFYLDDAITVCGNEADCRNSIKVMVDTAEKAGFVVQQAKTVGPARKITFLGIEIDSINAQLKIPREKLQEVRQELSTWLDKISCTKRELLSILGVLQYFVRKWSETVVNSLVDLFKRARKERICTLVFTYVVKPRKTLDGGTNVCATIMV